MKNSFKRENFITSKKISKIFAFIIIDINLFQYASRTIIKRATVYHKMQNGLSQNTARVFAKRNSFEKNEEVLHDYEN